MSQIFEESSSPISEAKMDISAGTPASNGSTCISPEKESDTNGIEHINGELITSQLEDEQQHQTEVTQGIDEKLNNYKNHGDIAKQRNEITIPTSPPSNNQIKATAITNLGQTRTPVSKHPLMSPTSITPDTQSPRRIVNYPDIVPDIDFSSDQFDRVHDLSDSMHHSAALNLSPEYLSDTDSEPDMSQYEAYVEPSFQTVALISNSVYKLSAQSIQNVKAASTRRKISVSADLLSDDISSVDTLSNQSFDDDMEHNLTSLSPSSSAMEDVTLNSKIENITIKAPEAHTTQPIPEYTAAEERRDSRHWQKITLPNGNTREIDMKVIDPYKRVLSHGGYLKAGGHNAIVIFSACHLPDRSRTDYNYVMDNLFLYVVKTLDQLVTEDYVLVYLHGGSNRGNVPPFPWLKQCYQLIDRRLRKSLKHLFLVHPTFWIKSMVWMSRPFISSKFWRKMIYVRSLNDLYKLVPLEKTAVPDKVKNYDSNKYSC